jgi:2-hydroxy-3-keto-5-methylthiopentenyl-1-phosphate phosphatase
MSGKIFKIFIDFDGTITKVDVGSAIFEKFGEPNAVAEVIKKYLDDNVTAKECWLLLCDSVKNLDRNEFDKYIESFEIDPTFHDFINYCRDNQFEHFVLSDGFDYYIDKILKREKLEGLKYYSNKLLFDENNNMTPIFPYLDEESKSSANCKHNHIINNSADEEFTVYIGDGVSDKETAQFCDFIFAKDDLLIFCEKERITYFPYKNFCDVIKKLNELKSKKRLKKRHQASLKRREVYLRG